MDYRAAWQTHTATSPRAVTEPVNIAAAASGHSVPKASVRACERRPVPNINIAAAVACRHRRAATRCRAILSSCGVDGYAPSMRVSAAPAREGDSLRRPGAARRRRRRAALWGPHPPGTSCPESWCACQPERAAREEGQPHPERRRPQGQEDRRLLAQLHRHHPRAYRAVEEVRPQRELPGRRFGVGAGTGAFHSRRPRLRPDRRGHPHSRAGVQGDAQRRLSGRWWRPRRTTSRSSVGPPSPQSISAIRTSSRHAPRRSRRSPGCSRHRSSTHSTIPRRSSPRSGKRRTSTRTSFREWFATFSQIPAAVSEEDIVAMQRVWEFSREMGILEEYPNAADVVWEHAIRE